MAKLDRTAARSALPAPLGTYKCCVAYRRHGSERFSPWFYNPDHAARELNILTARFGAAILVRD